MLQKTVFRAILKADKTKNSSKRGEKTVTLRTRRYLLAHLCAAAVLLLFYGYAWLMGRAFPNGYFHCALHDILHLYCPFCGGTRALFAVFRLDFAAILRLNAALPPAALIFAVLDVRALVLLCRHSEKSLFPRWLFPAAVACFIFFFVLRVALLLFGFDPAGDLLVFWQGFPAWRAAVATATLTLAGAALWLTLFGTRRRAALFPLAVFLITAALWIYLPY